MHLGEGLLLLLGHPFQVPLGQDRVGRDTVQQDLAAELGPAGIRVGR